MALSAFSTELIVVLNTDKPDHSSAVLADRIITSPIEGKSRAIRDGIAACRGTIFLVTDDDVRVPANWVNDMISPIAEGATDIVQGGVGIAPHLERPWLTGMLRTWVAAVDHPLEAPPGWVTANMSMTREAWDSTGGPDVRLGAGASGFYEDTIMGLIAEKKGFRKHYLPTCHVIHHFDGSRLNLANFIKISTRMAASRRMAIPEEKHSFGWWAYSSVRLLFSAIKQLFAGKDWVSESFIYWHYQTMLCK